LQSTPDFAKYQDSYETISHLGTLLLQTSLFSGYAQPQAPNGQYQREVFPQCRTPSKTVPSEGGIFMISTLLLALANGVLDAAKADEEKRGQKAYVDRLVNEIRQIPPKNETDQGQSHQRIPRKQRNQHQPLRQEQWIKASFGCFFPPEGWFEVRGAEMPDLAEMEELLADGYAVVFKSPSGVINIGTPLVGYRFSPQEIRQIEVKMGVNRKSPVQWFMGSLSPKP
jgi:hypothetical protein